MKTILRWLKIVTLCKLGFHPPFTVVQAGRDATWNECPRCHAVLVRRGPHSVYMDNKDAWQVARGFYDTGLHE